MECKFIYLQRKLLICHYFKKNRKFPPKKFFFSTILVKNRIFIQVKNFT